MNDIMKFEFENSENLECIELDGEPLFDPLSVGKCLNLGEKSVKTYVSAMNNNQRINVRELSKNESFNLKLKKGDMGIWITESGLYQLIFKSRKPEAQTFVAWVTDEVLPSIRKTGKFSTQPQLPNSNPMELEFNIKKLEDLKIAKAPEISNINKQSARGKLNTLITTLSHEKKISTGVLYDRLYARYAEYKGLFIPLEAERMGKDNKWYLRHHATISEELYEFALTYFYHGKTVVELFNLDPAQKTLGEF